MKCLHSYWIGLALALAGAAWCAGSDTGWANYASDLPSDVKERLQTLHGSSAQLRERQTVRGSAKVERERFLQSLPEAERERLRQKIRRLEEQPSSSTRASGTFRDR